MLKSYFCSILIFLSFFTSIYSYFFNKDIFIVSGIFAWIAFLIFFPTLQKKRLLIILLISSFIFLIISYYNSFKINFYEIFVVNQYLITLLIGVSFLRLIATPKNDDLKSPLKGMKSFVKTYFGVHLFASIINLSALILIADKMYKKGYLTNTQIILLTRSFANDAYWSPFFVAFATAVVYMPNLDTSVILVNGVFLATFGFLITYYEVKNDNKNKITDFEGYPLNFSTLALPFCLAFLVLITHYLSPDTKVIVLIALFSFILTFFILTIKSGFKSSFSEIKKHILFDLPKMKAEISLFLVAGMFGVTLSSILIGLNLELPFEIFDWKIASILLAIFIILGFIGIHPLITIAIIGNLLNEVNHTLLAVTFLMAWSIVISTSPFSGLILTIVSRYNLDIKNIFRLNIFYIFKIYLLNVIFLFLLSKYLNI